MDVSNIQRLGFDYNTAVALSEKLKENKENKENSDNNGKKEKLDTSSRTDTDDEHQL